jgi:hypothetical protein
MACKFCGIHEGAPDRKGKPAHINRDGLCAPCYYILERMKRQPDALTNEQHAWFEEMCRFNMKHGMFVPVARRRDLAHLKPNEPWICRRCGTTVEANRDNGYKNYCTMCADEIRLNRVSGQKRRSKTRSDKGGTHAGYRRPSMAAHKFKW